MQQAPCGPSYASAAVPLLTKVRGVYMPKGPAIFIGIGTREPGVNVKRLKELNTLEMIQ